MSCPVCKRKKCVWIKLKPNPEKLSTDELSRVISHNNDYIEYIFRDNNNGSAYAEERMYGELTPYVDELERRKR